MATPDPHPSAPSAGPIYLNSSCLRNRPRCGPVANSALFGDRQQARGILRRLLGKLRAAFPAAALRVRLDGGFAHPKLFTFLEQQEVEYVVAMASNTRLAKRARRLLGKVRMRSKATGQTEHVYGETRYAARTWGRRRRVIIKAEVVRHPGRDPKNNPRFVVRVKVRI